jgi:hypothetical protein
MINRVFNSPQSRVHNADFSPGSEERIGRSAGAEEKIQRRFQREAARPPISKVRNQNQLPGDFISSALARIEILLREQNWEGVKNEVDVIHREWGLRAIEARPMADIERSIKLAMHVNRLGLSHRISNMICDVCSGTVGSLLEAFPVAFMDHFGVGPETVRTIAEALLAAGVIDVEEAQQCIDHWVSETNKTRKKNAASYER